MSDKMRDEFEARFPTPEDVVWAGKEYRFVGKTPSQGMIYFIEFNSKWDGWQASRAAIEVELPRVKCFGGSVANLGLPIDGVVKAIESLGLKVKP